MTAVRGLSKKLYVTVMAMYFVTVYVYFRKNYAAEDLKSESEYSTVACSVGPSREEKSKPSATPEPSRPPQHIPTFILALCKGSENETKLTKGGDVAADFQRQLHQATIMLKSAAALTRTKLRIFIVADSYVLYQELLDSLQWPKEYHERLELMYRQSWFPPDRQEFRSFFRICSAERLFLPSMFPDLDAAVYLDTDMLFFVPPEELWNHFYKFNDKQLLAMTPCLNNYGTVQTKIPFIGETGLNAGILLMNLTRIKGFPGTWIRKIIKVFEEYKDVMTIEDQDILNIIVAQHQDTFYQLGCEWNYRKFLCRKSVNTCRGAEEQGVLVLHGNALAFASDRERKFLVLFQEWEKHNLGESLVHLLQKMKKALKAETKSPCSKIKGIDKILTKGLQSFIEEEQMQVLDK